MAVDALSAEIAGLDMCLPARGETEPAATSVPEDPAPPRPEPAVVEEDSDPERTRRNRLLGTRVLTTHLRSRGKARP
jgi:hypothetical protein